MLIHFFINESDCYLILSHILFPYIVLNFQFKAPVAHPGMCITWSCSWASDSSVAGVLSPGEESLPTHFFLCWWPFISYSFFPFNLLL